MKQLEDLYKYLFCCRVVVYFYRPLSSPAPTPVPTWRRTRRSPSARTLGRSAHYFGSSPPSGRCVRVKDIETDTRTVPRNFSSETGGVCGKGLRRTSGRLSSRGGSRRDSKGPVQSHTCRGPKETERTLRYCGWGRTRVGAGLLRCLELLPQPQVE